MKKLLVILSSILLLSYSCFDGNVEQDKSEMSIEHKESGYIPPKVIPINQKSLSKITPGENGVPLPAKFKIDKSTIHLLPNQPIVPGISYLPKMKENDNSHQKATISKKPIVIPFNKGKLLFCTPGKQGFLLPKVYNLENSNSKNLFMKNYSVQYGDTIYQPVFKTYPAPILKPASTPIYKDNANRNIQIIGKNEGILSAMIWSITEDSRGNIWFGTFGGAICYDGSSFRTFTVNEGLNSNWVSSIYEDKHGRLWFSHQMANAGVTCYDGQKFCHYTIAQGLSGNQVNSVLEDKKGNIWFGTDNGLSCFTGKSFINYNDQQGLCYKLVFDLLEDDKGLLWIATLGGISVFNGKSFVDFTVKNGFFKANSIIEDKNKNYWFTAYGLGLIKFDGVSFTHYTEEQGLTSNNVVWNNNLIEDREGNIWVGTDKGLNCFDGKSFTRFTTDNGVSNNNISALCQDSGGNIWIGTRGNGVNCFATNSFSHYTEQEGLPLSTVRAIYEDKSGNVWIGTWGGGVSCFDGDSLANYDLSTYLKGTGRNDIRAIVEDKDGNLWFGTGNGLDCFDGRNLIHFGTEHGLPDDGIAHLYLDRKGKIWIGTWEGGLSCWDGKSFTNYNSIEEIGSFYVSPMFEDTKGNLWITTQDKGISCYDGEKFFKYSAEQGFPFEGAFGSVETANGGILVGTTEHGLSYLLEKRFFNFSSKNGLSDDNIIAIIDDNMKNIWVGTGDGLNFLKSDLFSKKMVSKWNAREEYPEMIYSFRVLDGLKSPGIYQHALCIDSKNRLWIGTNDALSILDLNKFKIPESIPKIQLNSIDIENIPVDFRLCKKNENNVEANDSLNTNFSNDLKFDSVYNFFNYPLGLELLYNLNHLTFHFSGIDWVASHKMVYQYKLEGLEKSWSQIGSRNFADFQNIPYGDYTFKVKAKGASGKWSKTFEYCFSIKPPWWHTWWARFFYLIVLLFIIWLIIRIRTRSLKRKQEELEDTINQRTFEIFEKNEVLEVQKKELKYTLEHLKQTQAELIQSEKMASLGQLIAGIAHEINTPLGAINASITTITDSTQQSIKLLPALAKALSDDELKLFMVFVNRSVTNNNLLTSKEERDCRRKLASQLEEKGIAEADYFADILVDMGIYDELENYLPLYKPQTMQAAYHFSMQIKNSKNIKMAVDRASKVVFALKSYAHYGNEESKLEANIIDGLETVLTLYQNQLKHGINLHKEFEEIPPILCYPDELNQVWTNLIHNAIQAMEGKGDLSIFVEMHSRSSVRVSITDTGQGITPEIKDRIFDAFFTTKPAGEGAGLGLYIVKQIIDKHKGTITFESEVGKGTTVIVELQIEL